MLKYFKKNKGFTLIELLVVIAIIAVLASIVLVSLNTARVKGRDARRVADIKSIQNALELYNDKFNGYPVPTADTTGGADLGLEKLKTEGYLPVIPKDPGTNAYYRYATDGTVGAGNTNVATVYQLAAILEEVGHSALDTDADKADTDTPAADKGYEIKGGLTGCITGGAAESTTVGNCFDVTQK